VSIIFVVALVDFDNVIVTEDLSYVIQRKVESTMPTRLTIVILKIHNSYRTTMNKYQYRHKSAQQRKTCKRLNTKTHNKERHVKYRIQTLKIHNSYRITINKYQYRHKSAQQRKTEYKDAEQRKKYKRKNTKTIRQYNE
jgi:hypothetical protein